MIVKLGEDPGFEEYAHRDRTVKAAKMRSDFLVETTLGFLPGKKGDYIVEIAPRVRFPCAEEAFLKSHVPVQLEDCDRRCGAHDRRKKPL